MPTSEDLQLLMSHVGKTWNFDVYWLEKLSNQNAFNQISHFLMKKFQLDVEFSMDKRKIKNFYNKIETLYQPNPYHNSKHATDVVHSFLFFITQSKILSCMSSLDMLSCILGACCHDVCHPGFTNRFLVQTRNQLAILYNDQSVLESMHASTAF